MNEAARGTARHSETGARADKENVDAVDRERFIPCRCPMRRSCWRCSAGWRRFTCRLRGASRSEVRLTPSDLHKFGLNQSVARLEHDGHNRASQIASSDSQLSDVCCAPT
jgi:hypothetical protein